MQSMFGNAQSLKRLDAFVSQVLTILVDTAYARIMQLSVYVLKKCYVSNDSPEVIVSEEEIKDGHIVSPDEAPTFKTVQEVLRGETRVHSNALAGKNTIMYVAGITVPVYKNPTIEFDAQIGAVPYGEMVMMLEPQGRFYKIVWNTLEGWVRKDDVVDRASRIYPEFTVGGENSVDHPNTVHIRAILGDIFGLNNSEFPLQAGEYVLYRLWKKNIRIAWPETRPRVPGLWHKLLRGVPRVQMSVTPKAGSIMEYMLNSDVGHVAYVEAVFPDNTITISEANYPDSGIYNERELAKEAWIELRPVFIQVQ